jgi:Ca-activated chloride channel homolog
MRFILFLSVLSVLCVGIAAQSRRVPQRPTGSPPVVQTLPTPPPDELTDPDSVISVDTKLVTIPVRVLDRRNRFIGGLQKRDFSIFEDGVEHELAFFSNEAEPFTVALMLDMSYSSTFKIDDIQRAAIAFIDQLRPEDKVMVVSFDEEVHMLCEPTSDRERIYSAIRSTRISTGTSLYEAVARTMNGRMRSIEGRRAIVLFTDGVDTTSREAHDLDNLRDAMELDALIYPIRYDTFADVQAMRNGGGQTSVPGLHGTAIGFPSGRTAAPPSTRDPATDASQRYPRNDPGRGAPIGRPPASSPGQKGTTIEEYRFGEEYLEKLATLTGGRSHLASTPGHLNAAFARIASELREFYSIGYYPGGEPVPGKIRRIKVKVNRQDVAVRARDSYAVPKGDGRAPSSR